MLTADAMSADYRGTVDIGAVGVSVLLLLVATEVAAGFDFGSTAGLDAGQFQHFCAQLMDVRRYCRDFVETANGWALVI